MLDSTPLSTSTQCGSCGTEYATKLLACPQCHRLAHADALKQLADVADEASRSGDLTTALAAWRDALTLLPPASRQYEAIKARIETLTRQIDEGQGVNPDPVSSKPAETPSADWSGKAGVAGLGTLALLALKFKFVLIMALTKGKLLLLGLTKASTLFSMLLSLGVYWTAFGWKFALGLVLSIYVHEMGHVAALRRFGIRAGAPMFIPGLGAFVRLKQTLPDARADARVGLAGPIWGLFGAIATYAAALATDSLMLAAIAKLAAWINLFNLIPIWQLDGGRGFRSMSRSERWFSALAIAVMWAVTQEVLLVLLLIGATLNAVTHPPSKESDRRATFEYVILVIAFSLLTMIPVNI
ncbi:site-2 protease family protein [Singulisphaera acidiphila]|uniref:Zn-dependent protease n=1 Tax=Singulisphaera acidiphila (strain ATCC BAA-1392 / DSM 18658 / VKM B-2454 / MOB10) TaxID=886293 RepID=L0DLI9_SINAD|nr:site-2 protease family protein [Singulisphaera acidiphila]AGA30254.1 Zn-dependent protease [Singulisphaera acidiphila DSM 18658]